MIVWLSAPSTIFKLSHPLPPPQKPSISPHPTHPPSLDCRCPSITHLRECQPGHSQDMEVYTPDVAQFETIQNSLHSINSQTAPPIYNQNQPLPMSSKQPLKNYYAILGVSENASLFEIESAYGKLANMWHPDKHKEHRKSAETKFHDISEAFEVLSDRNKRSHYDELLSKEYSLQDANTTFERFFNEQDALDEEEEKFFNQHYPNPLINFYNVLGVPRTATLDQIRAAYRKLALQYHPKNNPNDEAAHAKFVEVNEAFNALSSEFKRENYDNILFGEMVPVRAHNIFDDFFGSRLFSLEDDDFRPIFHNKWSRDLDRLMLDETEEKNIKDGETVKVSSVWSNNNGKEAKKTVTSKKTYKEGKVNEQTTEDYLFPNGERNVVKITNIDGKVDTKKYSLKKGEDLPKELTN